MLSRHTSKDNVNKAQNDGGTKDNSFFLNKNGKLLMKLSLRSLQVGFSDLRKIKEEVLQKAVEGMAEDGHPYKGIVTILISGDLCSSLPTVWTWIARGLMLESWPGMHLPFQDSFSLMKSGAKIFFVLMGWCYYLNFEFFKLL